MSLQRSVPRDLMISLFGLDQFDRSILLSHLVITASDLLPMWHPINSLSPRSREFFNVRVAFFFSGYDRRCCSQLLAELWIEM